MTQLLSACAALGLTQITPLLPQLSDPHNGGQCAALFSCGEKKYVYKPRSPAADVAWADFLDALAPLIDVPLPRAIRPISPPEADYTIVPFVEGAPACSEEQARLYYVRCGALLALCMVLGSTDLHAENLVADGDSPVLVDVETLLAGVTPDRAARGITFYDSLVFSHLLPNWMLQDDDNVDVGALTGAGRNLLKLHDAPCPAYDYTGEICAGFRQTIAGLLTHRAAVARELDRFAKVPFRKLLRPTDLYSRLCSQIARLDSEEDRRACAERLRRAYLRSGDAWAQKMSRACSSEIEAVLRGDIPCFFSLGDECCLRDMTGVVAEDYFTHSPLASAKHRLNALRPQDGAAQERVIRLSLRTVRPEAERLPLPSAYGVFELLEAQTIDGCPCVWMGLTTGARGEAYFQSIGFDLYEGLLGVLAFYGTLYEATGCSTVLQAIRHHYALYRTRYVASDRPLRATADSICLTSGLGGHLLLLGHLARTLQDDSFLCDAVRLLSRFDFSGFNEFDRWDVYGGICGLLIALPLLRGRGIDVQLARIAALLAEGVRHTAPALTGFAHGAAGLALALGAAQYVGGGWYAEDILRVLAWENAQYDDAALNWPDLRDPDRPGFMKGLCTGAPGIGLARAQLLQYVQDQQVTAVCHDDLVRVRRFLQMQEKPLSRDTLCCGNAALLEAWQALRLPAAGRPQLNDPPALYHPLTSDDFPVGLFQGWAGVGYALARQLPEARSSLFVWEVKT
ncbi:MAG: DUF4135 domain-containing protein [Clostridia bacterium]|nr:DUF4135 domain-containing protein [Clostridia bacterium]